LQQFLFKEFIVIISWSNNQEHMLLPIVTSLTYPSSWWWRTNNRASKMEARMQAG